jgi:uncharacterized membrane protein
MPERIIKNIIVKGQIKEIFSLWENYENFVYFMKDIKSVHKTGEKTSHWIMRGPLGKNLEWGAQITDHEENKRIAWNSILGDIKTSGQVTFNELGEDEVDVTVHMQYIPPAGGLGVAAARLFDNPEKRVEEGLRQFKKYAEGKFSMTASR